MQCIYTMLQVNAVASLLNVIGLLH